MTDVTKATSILRNIQEELNTAINCLSDNQSVPEKGASPSAIPASFANIVPEANTQTTQPASEPANQPVPTVVADTDTDTNTDTTPISPISQPVPEPADIPNSDKAGNTGDITSRLLDTFNSIKQKITPNDIKASAAQAFTKVVPTNPAPITAADEAPATPIPSVPVPPTVDSASIPPVVQDSASPTETTTIPAPVESTPATAESVQETANPTPEAQTTPNASFDALNSILSQDTSLPSQTEGADMPTFTSPDDSENRDC